MDTEFDKQKYEEDDRKARRQKDWMHAIGSATDQLLNAQSAAEILLGRNRAPSQVGKAFDSYADSIETESEKRKKMAEAYLQERGLVKAKEEDALLKREKDPNSMETKALKSLAPRWGIQVTPEMSAYDIKQMIDPKKMMETEAAANVKFGKQKQLKEMDFGQQKIIKGMELSAASAKDNKPRPLPAEAATKIGAYLGAADASSKIEDMGRTAVTGKVSALKDATKELFGIQSQDRAKFSADVANQRNEVMNKIAGANVVADEKARVLEGIPTRSDSPEQFQGKARSTTDQMLNKAESDVEALAAAGYDVSELRARLNSARQRISLARQTPATPKDGIDTQTAKAAAGPHGAFVIQNGIRYDWNPKTGAYE